ncbi:short chain dehydrogenase, partial [Xanthomonas citri pv. citri]|nr:short chain dehydrogenase [Xanthomonas citri pv. citri]
MRGVFLRKEGKRMNKTALITGVSGGIGKSISETLAA